VPADSFEQLEGMTVAGGIVAAIAVPVGVTLAVVSRGLGISLIPPWRHSQSRFTGVEILFIFGFYYTLMIVGPQVLDSLGFYGAIYGPEVPKAENFRVIRHLWVTLFIAPLLFVGSLAIPRFMRSQTVKFEPKRLPGQIAFAVLGWLVVTPMVLGIYYVTLLVVQNIGGAQQEHPLTQSGPGASLLEQGFFGFVVCVMTPLAEEVLFRGLLVRWAAGRWYRPWILVAAAAFFLLMTMTPERVDFGPIALAALFGMGLYAIQKFDGYRPRFAVLTCSAVFSSAALFGSVHISVWPTPVPLFFLGFALGYVTLRTRSIIGPVVIHGLFNAVSFVFLLRTGPT